MPSYEESSRTRRSARRRPIVFELPVADQMLPLVQRIVADIVERSVRLGHLRLESQRERANTSKSWQRRCNRFKIEDQIQHDEKCLEDLRQELSDLGIKLLDAPHGIVGFPTIVNGSLAYLVYRHEDDGVWYWRYRDQPKLRPIPECWYEQNPFAEEENEGLLV